jgi:hypothetical protein
LLDPYVEGVFANAGSETFGNETIQLFAVNAHGWMTGCVTLRWRSA